MLRAQKPPRGSSPETEIQQNSRQRDLSSFAIFHVRIRLASTVQQNSDNASNSFSSSCCSCSCRRVSYFMRPPMQDSDQEPSIVL